VRSDTVAALRERRDGHSLRALAEALGLPRSFAPTLSHVLNERHDQISRERENVIRAALGLPPIGTAEVAFCPSCGKIHVVEDCKGKSGELAIIGRTERIIDMQRYRVIPRRRCIKRWRDLPFKALAAAIRNRKPYP